MSVNPNKFGFTAFDSFSDEVITDGDMFGSGMIRVIASHCNCALIISIYDGGLKKGFENLSDEST